jgi:hypothetical protein
MDMLVGEAAPHRTYEICTKNAIQEISKKAPQYGILWMDLDSMVELSRV